MSRKKQEADLDPEKPLFMHKSNPNKDYDQWATEYDSLELEHMKQVGPGNAVANLKNLRMRKPQLGRKYRTPAAAVARRSPSPADVTSSQGDFKKVDNNIRTVFRSPTVSLRSPARDRETRPRSTMSRHAAVSPTLSSPKRALTPLSIASGGNKTCISGTEIRAVLALLDSSSSRTYNVDTRCINLSWMKHLSDRKAAPGMTHLTLFNIPQELIDEKGVLHERDAITSPRSAFILLSSGTSVQNLQILPDSCFTSSQNPANAKQLHEDSRVQLLRSLQDQYRSLIENQSIEDVVAAAISSSISEDQSTAVLRRKDQAGRLLSACRRRLERHEELANAARQAEFFAEQERVKRVVQIEEEKKKKQRDLSNRIQEAARRKEERRKELERKMDEETNMIAERLEKLKNRDETRKLLNQERSESARRTREAKQKQKMEQFARNKQNNDSNIEELRQRAELKSQQAEERKREYEFLKQRQKEQQTRQIEFVAERRKEHIQKSIEASNQKRDAAIEKQQLADLRAKQRQQEQEIARQTKREQERELSKLRAEKKEASHTMEIEKAEEYRQRNIEKKREFEVRKKEREQLSSYQKQIQAAEADNRSLKVLCQGRANEFRKALIQQDIDQKAARVEATKNMKERMIKECWNEREMLRREKEAMLQRNAEKTQKEKISLAQ
eukprot:TRINITY_DN10565_c0_g1_i1.p1 TRINITY_DN10565_c0_g1~~TRINITY_DN10565_c0_g1_i1.p1  ORF type:complete len:672 (+),score=172.71 TRINITY_DN10565_c0_g1_i1:163-2178(+)